MRARRAIGACLWGGTALLGAGTAALGWVIARKLTAPVGPRTFNLVVRDVEDDDGALRIVLDRTPDTTAEGLYNLWFERGGCVQLGSEMQGRGPNRIARAVTGAANYLNVQVGDSVSWSGVYFATPADAGLEAHDIMINTPSGYAPAWRVNGSSSTWAIHIHGLSSPRAGTLRGVQVATQLGYTSLVLSFRNDGEGPRIGSGRSTLGATEVDDVEAAISYAVRRGAERFVLFGWSMGAAIALQLAHRSDYAKLIAGLVLDSPVLDWGEAIKANCARSGLPAAAGHLAIPWLALEPLARMVGLPSGIPLREFDWVQRAEELAVPTLILHGIRDNSTPVDTAKALHVQRPDVVTLETFNADHTLNWNADPNRWREAVTDWLQVGPVRSGNLRT
ncbi:alpha/beta hydrolase family protein [Leucobacter salsicius]|uniref:alpha/beta hydrolase family protein n=1 Tax=Leucobacter salsicius TaxID=664638 RepID=UPI001E415D09|nr:alpha/beta hydrolase [Leucobacter salsicius]